ncbi:LysR family transcriptional regulator [Komagataeibacter rhaeticus]|uniref:LysR family transcriptional regulator n=1 Tax=Komagataeibacter rhaeticus TaxID=215221 RepID=UPI0039EC79EF
MDRLQAMTVFVRVVETGSFTAAARQMGMGQPAVSKIVAGLEQQLGTQLLLRSTHGLTPTDTGQRYFERVARVIADANEADALARNSLADLSGRLRVAAPTTFGRLQIIPRLGRFLSAHPRLEVDIELDDRRVDLVAEGIDVALRVGPLHESAVVARRLARGRRSVIATPAYLARGPALISPKDLTHHQAILYTRGGTLRQTFRRGEESVDVTLGSRLRLSAAEGVRAAVLADLGLTVSADWMFLSELRTQAVVRCLRDWTLPAVDLWALLPAGRLTSARARAFMDFVTEIIQQVEAEQGAFD